MGAAGRGSFIACQPCFSEESELEMKKHQFNVDCPLSGRSSVITKDEHVGRVSSRRKRNKGTLWIDGVGFVDEQSLHTFFSNNSDAAQKIKNDMGMVDSVYAAAKNDEKEETCSTRAVDDSNEYSFTPILVTEKTILEEGEDEGDQEKITRGAKLDGKSTKSKKIRKRKNKADMTPLGAMETREVDTKSDWASFFEGASDLFGTKKEENVRPMTPPRFHRTKDEKEKGDDLTTAEREAFTRKHSDAAPSPTASAVSSKVLSARERQNYRPVITIFSTANAGPIFPRASSFLPQNGIPNISGRYENEYGEYEVIGPSGIGRAATFEVRQDNRDGSITTGILRITKNNDWEGDLTNTGIVFGSIYIKKTETGLKTIFKPLGSDEWGEEMCGTRVGPSTTIK